MHLLKNLEVLALKRENIDDRCFRIVWIDSIGIRIPHNGIDLDNVALWIHEFTEMTLRKFFQNSDMSTLYGKETVAHVVATLNSICIHKGRIVTSEEYEHYLFRNA